MFRKYVAIDWSGADNYQAAVDIRVAIKRPDGHAEIEPPLNGRPKQRGWSRAALFEWLTAELKSGGPSIVAFDFGFGFPWGACDRVFDAPDWHEMIARIESDCSLEGRGREVARVINHGFDEKGPFWIDDLGAPPRRLGQAPQLIELYHQMDLPYYRLVEIAIPEAKSQWYAGYGASVSLQTLTGLSVLAKLARTREEGTVSFKIWPHEVWKPDGGNVIVECYPALYDNPDQDHCIPEGYNRDSHAKDAWKVLQWMLRRENEGTLEGCFQIHKRRFGRVTNVRFRRQIQMEGWIIGVP
jgi:hypothetical protein